MYDGNRGGVKRAGIYQHDATYLFQMLAGAEEPVGAGEEQRERCDGSGTRPSHVRDKTAMPSR